MARARNIKPSFFENDELVECSFAARLCFIGLWTLADREGRLEDRPRKIKMALFPADDVEVDELISELAHVGLIVRYRASGMSLISIPKFSKHQRPHHNESASELPGPDQAEQPKEESACVHGEKDGEPQEQALRPESPSLNDESLTTYPVSHGDTEGEPQKPKLDDIFGSSEQATTFPAVGQAPDPPESRPQPESGCKRFDEFWSRYPTIRRREKKRAREIWRRKKLDSKADDIIADVERRKARDPQWTKDGGQYVPMPTTYLNGERWDDELPDAATVNGSGRKTGEEDPRYLPPDDFGRAPWNPDGSPNREYRGGTYWP